MGIVRRLGVELGLVLLWAGSIPILLVNAYAGSARFVVLAGWLIALTVLAVLSMVRPSGRSALLLAVLAAGATLVAAFTGLAAPVTVPDPVPVLLVFVVPGLALLDAAGAVLTVRHLSAAGLPIRAR